VTRLLKAIDSGGANDPLLGAPRKIGATMQDIFAAQFQEAMKRNIADTGDYEWVASQDWADEIVRLQQGNIGVVMAGASKVAQREVGVSITDFVDRPAVQHAIRHEAMEFARAVGESTRDKLRDTLAQGVAAGESAADMEGRIKTVLGFDPELGIYTPAGQAGSRPLENWRAERIARTESAQASTLGERETYRESGVVEAVEWSASADACPFCLAMDGKLCNFNAPYLAKGSSMTVRFEGKEYVMDFNYRNVDGPPLHCSCRCSLLPVLVEIYQGE